MVWQKDEHHISLCLCILLSTPIFQKYFMVVWGKLKARSWAGGGQRWAVLHPHSRTSQWPHKQRCPVWGFQPVRPFAWTEKGLFCCMWGCGRKRKRCAFSRVSPTWTGGRWAAGAPTMLQTCPPCDRWPIEIISEQCYGCHDNQCSLGFHLAMWQRFDVSWRQSLWFQPRSQSCVRTQWMLDLSPPPPLPLLLFLRGCQSMDY